MEIRQLLNQASQQLASISESPRLDAEILLAHYLDKSRTWLVTWADKTLNEDQILSFQSLLKKRLQGTPIAHITGQREFWSLPLKVTPDTLIPRPDTELMIEVLLENYPDTYPKQLLDLGTGSGAIALAMAAEKPSWQVTASDRSVAALTIAQQNAVQLGLTNIEFVEGSWFEPVAGQRFEIIASNPPYIPQQDPHLQQGDVRFEPLSALASGEDGLDDIRLICSQASGYLNPGGMLIIEHGYDQKPAVFKIFQQNQFKNIQQYNDLAQNPRLTSGIIH